MESEMLEGVYRIEVRPRKGAANGLSCNFDDLDRVWYFWRVLNNAEGDLAAITIRKEDGCCDCIPRKWRDELVFWRLGEEGADDHLAYIGSVLSVLEDPSNDTITIFARSRNIKAFDSKLTASQTHVYTELTADADGNVLTEDTRIDAMDLFLELWADAISCEDLCLTLEGTFEPTGVLVTADVQPGDDLGSELQRLLDLAVDVAVVGNVMYVGGLAIDAAPFDALNPEVHWQNATGTVLDDGNDTVTVVTVIGRDGISSTFPPDPADHIHPEFGKLHEVIEVNTIETQEECDAYARTYFDQHSPNAGIFVGTEDQDGSISCEWPVPMSQMIPGRLFEFDTSLAEGLYCLNRKVSTRLQSIRVDGINEFEDVIKVALIPEGT